MNIQRADNGPPAPTPVDQRNRQVQQNAVQARAEQGAARQAQRKDQSREANRVEAGAEKKQAQKAEVRTQQREQQSHRVEEQPPRQPDKANPANEINIVG